MKINHMVSAIVAFGLAATPVMAQETQPFKVGVVTFLSGAAAGPFGVPARYGAEVTPRR